MSLISIFEQCGPIGRNVAESIKEVRVTVMIVVFLQLKVYHEFSSMGKP